MAMITVCAGRRAGGERLGPVEGAVRAFPKQCPGWGEITHCRRKGAGGRVGGVDERAGDVLLNG